jgi:hypothetical protein
MNTGNGCSIVLAIMSLFVIGLVALMLGAALGIF